MARPKKQHLKRRKDGRYCAVYHGKQFMGETEAEALTKRDEYKRQEAKGEYKKTNQTISEYAAYWLPIHKADVKPSTYNGYISILETTLKPIEDIQLYNLTTDDIAEAYAKLNGRSASYIHKARILLTAILDSATDAGYMRKNPCRALSVKPPKGSRGTHRAITEEECQLILNTPHRMQTGALIMLFCGLRRGELLALTAEDIQDGEIIVSRSVSFVSNQPIISTPKTSAGTRRVPVPDILQPYLDGLSGYVMQTHTGQPMTLQAYSRGWESYMAALSAAAGHEIKIRAHDLRHSYCTMLRDAGIDMHQAIIWMGHADEQMILRIYDHPGEARERDAKNRLNSSLNMLLDMQKQNKKSDAPV